MPVSSDNTESHTIALRGVDDLSLVGDEWNPDAESTADQPTVLLLHAGGQNRHSWKNTGQTLAERGFHVIAFDARGHGDSDRSPSGNYSVDALNADVLRVLYQIGRPVVLIGASMGALTGILAAHEAGPELVKKLVLVDVVPRFEKSGSARIRDFMLTHVHGFDSPFLTKPDDDPFLRVEKLEQAASNLTIPILLIRGTLSDVVSAEGIAGFLERVPAAEFVELSDAGHTAAGDANDAFTEAVVEFVTR